MGNPQRTKEDFKYTLCMEDKAFFSRIELASKRRMDVDGPIDAL